MMVTPIFAALPQEDQWKVFQPTPQTCRKLVLATNIAETSVTIDGIKYVVDSGYVKMRSFVASTGFETLKVCEGM